MCAARPGAVTRSRPGFDGRRAGRAPRARGAGRSRRRRVGEIGCASRLRAAPATTVNCPPKAGASLAWPAPAGGTSARRGAASASARVDRANFARLLRTRNPWAAHHARSGSEGGLLASGVVERRARRRALHLPAAMLRGSGAARGRLSPRLQWRDRAGIGPASLFLRAGTQVANAHAAVKHGGRSAPGGSRIPSGGSAPRRAPPPRRGAGRVTASPSRGLRLHLALAAAALCGPRPALDATTVTLSRENTIVRSLALSLNRFRGS